jgi:hypothetical protein
MEYRIISEIYKKSLNRIMNGHIMDPLVSWSVGCFTMAQGEVTVVT